MKPPEVVHNAGWGWSWNAYNSDGSLRVFGANFWTRRGAQKDLDRWLQEQPKPRREPQPW